MAAVAAHLIVAMLHGAAHNQAHVSLGLGAALFVAIIVIAGPLAGVGLMFLGMRWGSWLVAVTMAGSLLFGLVMHFLLAGPDHAMSVSRARPLFLATSILLACTEAFGCAFAIGFSCSGFITSRTRALRGLRALR